jgi:hypothetical protein
MTPRALPLLLALSFALLLASLIACITIQRADYRMMVKLRREDVAAQAEDWARILEVLGRKAVLVSPIDASAFDRAAADPPRAAGGKNQ